MECATGWFYPIAWIRWRRISTEWLDIQAGGFTWPLWASSIVIFGPIDRHGSGYTDGEDTLGSYIRQYQVKMVKASHSKCCLFTNKSCTFDLSTIQDALRTKRLRLQDDKWEPQLKESRSMKIKNNKFLNGYKQHIIRNKMLIHIICIVCEKLCTRNIFEEINHKSRSQNGEGYLMLPFVWWCCFCALSFSSEASIAN